MTLLQEHIKRSGQADFGVQAFVTDVLARFPERPREKWGFRKEVKCLWQLQYASRTSTVLTILFLPLMILAGHAAAWTKKTSFVTYHYLEPSELRRLKLWRILKNLLLPLAIFGMGISGIVGVIALIGVCVEFNSPEPVPDPHSKPIPFSAVVLTLLVAWALFAGAIKVQRLLWKLGDPQDSDCFCDQRIQLSNLAITK
jgi:hypothetical protein